MKWLVELQDFRGDKRLLADVLKELSMAAVDANGGLFLTGRKFEDLDTPSDVYEEASKLQGIVQQVCGHAPPVELGFSIGSVVEVTPDGSKRRHHFLTIHDSVHAQDAAEVALDPVTSARNISEEERERLEADRVEREYEQRRVMAVTRIVSAISDDRAFTAQRLLAGELSPMSLGHVADLIHDDPEGRATDLASKNEWTRFYRSINHPFVFGESARHIVSNVEPPSNPMTLCEARSFIDRVANKWLTAKVASRGEA
jgi:hypothetical protein